MAEPVTDTANAAAREAVEVAAKKIEDLRAQLVAKKAETDAASRKAAEAADEKIVALRAQLAAEQAKTIAAHETAGRQTAEAKEAAELAAATAASIREAAALEAQIAALHATYPPAPPGGDPNSRVAEALALLRGPRTRSEAADDVSVLNQDEVAAPAHENEVSRLALCKRSAAEESGSDSDDEVPTSFFASQI